MSRFVFSLRSDWPAELRRIFPRITQPQIDAFRALIEADRLVDDDGAPTEALVARCEGAKR